MEATTYTVLVTVVHGAKGHSSSRIGEAIQQALKEGTSEYPGFYAALVDVEGPGDRAADDAALDASNAAPPYRRLMMSKAGGNFD